LRWCGTSALEVCQKDTSPAGRSAIYGARFCGWLPHEPRDVDRFFDRPSERVCDALIHACARGDDGPAGERFTQGPDRRQPEGTFGQGGPMSTFLKRGPG
jgi:hypothetical protein